MAEKNFHLPHSFRETQKLALASRPPSRVGDLEKVIRIYETILSTTDDFAYIFDPQGRFLYANAPLLTVWAKTLDDVIGKTCHELGYPEWHADLHMREIEQIVRDKVQIRGEVPFTGDSGISGVYDYIFKPVFDASGNVEIIVGTTRDVTERKRAEENLKSAQLELEKRAAELESALQGKIVSEQRYRFLADTVPQIVWTAKPDGNLDYYNERWFDYAGTNLEEMEKVGWTFFVHPDDLPNAARVWQKALETGGAYEVEFRIKRASDGSYRWHLVRAFPMSNEQGAVIQWVGTCTDIDDQRQLSEQLGETAAKLKDANEQLGDRAAHLEALVQQRTHRLSETVGELEAFSYSISHDMRSPLRSMIGFADVLKEDYANKLDATGLDYLNRISNASRRMDRLSQDVLSFSRIGSQNIALGPVDADALIRDVIGSYPNLQSERVQITFISRLPSVQANEALLTQCFSNLMENAAKFVTPGNKAQIEVWSETSGTRTRLYFKDHGIGIPDHSIARIFDIFHRVGRDTDGTGIGLAIVRKAVEKMGGKVGVESELGQGSLFWLDLELASESLSPA